MPVQHGDQPDLVARLDLLPCFFAGDDAVVLGEEVQPYLGAGHDHDVGLQGMVAGVGGQAAAAGAHRYAALLGQAVDELEHLLQGHDLARDHVLAHELARQVVIEFPHPQLTEDRELLGKVEYPEKEGQETYLYPGVALEHEQAQPALLGDQRVAPVKRASCAGAAPTSSAGTAAVHRVHPRGVLPDESIFTSSGSFLLNHPVQIF